MYKNLISKKDSAYRIELCETIVKMNKDILEYAVVGFSPDLYFDNNGKPKGIFQEQVEILKDYLNFNPLINTNASSFIDHVKTVEKGAARVGSPQVANFE